MINLVLRSESSLGDEEHTHFFTIKEHSKRNKKIMLVT